MPTSGQIGENFEIQNYLNISIFSNFPQDFIKRDFDIDNYEFKNAFRISGVISFTCVFFLGGWGSSPQNKDIDSESVHLLLANSFYSFFLEK